MDRARPTGPSISPAGDQRPGLGQIKWFGGVNTKTDLENDFGFISAPGRELFFHRDEAYSPPQSLLAGADVVFLQEEGRKGPQARFVQVLSSMADGDLIDLLRDQDWCSSEETLTILLYRDNLEPFETLSLGALGQLMAADATSPTLGRFWQKFAPSSPASALYALAPDDVKSQVCRRHYGDFRTRLLGLFSSVKAAETSMEPASVYEELDERDEQLALQWVARRDNEGSLAKMLSARGAELAAKRFYEAVGSNVEDVSIRQLDGDCDDWKTHDLLVDSNIAVDVKNARRPCHGTAFYVEHTVARFKLDRGGKHVRIAGVLSPYLGLKDIREPDYRVLVRRGDLVYLGETSRASIDQLQDEFSSETFEVSRPDERTFPHWMFGYPDAWYRALSSDVERLNGECTWPDEDHWQHTLDDLEKMLVIPALCFAREPLPESIASKLAGWQVDFYVRMQGLLPTSPHAPTIFLTVLTDFLEKLVRQPPDFSPKDYLPLLFGQQQRREDSVTTPLGAIDPLGIVHELVSTLEILWANRSDARLEHMSNFRFVGLGLLQGRERGHSGWKTILAYCGGTVYGLDDESGEVMLGLDGKPSKVNGKCGNTPLVVGREKNCQDCGKLICGECRFCSLPCEQRRFAPRVRIVVASINQPRGRR